MEKLSYKTRGMSSPQGKQRVYFTCHPADFKLYFEKISEEILKLQNCAIWYKKELEEVDTADLSQMQLFVIPITERFLQEKNHALEVEFQYALEHHIPILPIMQESGLVEVFNRICGDLQWIDPYAQDETAIGYNEKLSKFLSSILVGDELAEKVRAAFDAYIFLSYRKKDRKYAKELMRLIHKNEFCRDIAIWYDEFLIPGENFNKAIEGALKKSELFALTVTPNLVNEDNYVMSTEYPMAKEAGKMIFPVEMVATDKDELQKKYLDIPNCVNVQDESILSKELLACIQKLAIKENDHSSEHNFFIGLAYLGGIDVEVNHEQAVTLIAGAAELGLPEAMEKLVAMYRNGEGVARDYKEAVKWQEKLTESFRKKYEENKTSENGHDLIARMTRLGNALKEIEEEKRSLEVFEECVKYGEEIAFTFEIEQNYKDLTTCYGKLASVYTKAGEQDKALRVLSKDLALCEGLVAKGAGEHLRGLSSTYESIADIFLQANKFSQARSYLDKALEIREQLASTGDGKRRYEDLAVCYANIGMVCRREKKFEEAEAFCAKAISLNEKLFEEQQDPVRMDFLIQSYDGMGRVWHAQKEYAKAQIYYLKSLQIMEMLASETESVKNYRQLAKGYEYVGTIYKKLNKLDSTICYYEKAFHIRKKLAELTGTLDNRETLLGSISVLGEAYLEKKDWENAKACFERMEKMAEEILEQTGNLVENRRNLVISKVKLGNLYKESGKLDIARTYYEKALEITKEIQKEENTGKIRKDIAVCYANLGAICEEEGRLEEARQYYVDAFEIHKALYDEEPTKDGYAYCAIACKKMINTYRLEGNMGGMLKWFAVFESLGKVD